MSWEPPSSGGSITWPSKVIDEGGQVFNVKAYGAKGDGVTDDTAAIQAAINAASAAYNASGTQATVIGAAGATYFCTYQPFVSVNWGLPALIIFSGVVIDGMHLTFPDYTQDAGHPAQPCVGIAGWSVVNTAVRNCFLAAAGPAGSPEKSHYGIQILTKFGTTASNMDFSGNLFSGWRSNGVLVSGDNTGTLICQTVWIQKNIFTNCGHGPETADGGKDIWITDNWITNGMLLTTGEEAISISDESNFTSNVFIQRNVIDTFSFGITCGSGSNIWITDNLVDCSATPVALPSITIGCLASFNQLYIQRNVCINNSPTSGATAASAIVVGHTGPTIANSSDIWITDNWLNNNIANGNATGIQVDTGTSGFTITNLHIERNHVYGIATNTGIQFGNCVGAYIRENVVNASVPIKESNSTGPATTGLVISANTVNTLGTNNFLLVGQTNPAMIINNNVSSNTRCITLLIGGSQVRGNTLNGATGTNVISEATGASGSMIETNSFVGTAKGIGWAAGSLSVGRNNQGYNPVGVVVVAVPLTTVAVAAANYDRTFYVTAGATSVSLVIQNGPTIVVPALGLGTVRVPAGLTLTPTYTNAPTWVVEGE